MFGRVRNASPSCIVRELKVSDYQLFNPIRRHWPVNAGAWRAGQKYPAPAHRSALRAPQKMAGGIKSGAMHKETHQDSGKLFQAIQTRIEVIINMD